MWFESNLKRRGGKLFVELMKLLIQCNEDFNRNHKTVACFLESPNIKEMSKEKP